MRKTATRERAISTSAKSTAISIARPTERGEHARSTHYLSLQPFANRGVHGGWLLQHDHVAGVEDHLG